MVKGFGGGPAPENYAYLYASMTSKAVARGQRLRYGPTCDGRCTYLVELRYAASDFFPMRTNRCLRFLA